jgi:hypothetical protein
MDWKKRKLRQKAQSRRSDMAGMLRQPVGVVGSFGEKIKLDVVKS